MTFVHRMLLVVMGLVTVPLNAMAQNVLWKVDGDPDAYVFGHAVNPAGDVDGDGVEDVVIGFGSNITVYGVGGVGVYSGTDGREIHRLYGDINNGFLGRSVDSVGDINDDGVPDFVAGGDNANIGGQTEAGYVRVYSGLDGAVLYELTGPPLGGHFGFSCSGAGDVNMDGRPDFIIGAPEATNQKGHAEVYSGLDASILWDLLGTQTVGQFGRAVNCAGDFNQDGFSDVIVGTPFDNTNGNSAGRVTVFSGQDAGVLANAYGASAGDYFGYSVATSLVTQDSIPDLIVGAPRRDSNGADAGSVYLISGADLSTVHTWNGDTAGAQLGWSVSDAGDTDGDGTEDIVAGAPYDDSAGSIAGRVQVFSGLDGASLHAFDGVTANGEFGIAVARGGDLSQNSFSDVVIGARGDDTGGLPFGAVRVAAANGFPSFEPPTPCLDPQIVDVGSPLTFTVTAMAHTGTAQDPVTLTVTGDQVPLSAGTFQPPLPLTADPATTQFSWTPTAGTGDTYHIVFLATDSLGRTTQCSMAIWVRDGKTLFVDETAPPAGDGLSWDTAFTDLQDALDAADGDLSVTEIWIATGTYRPDRGTLDRSDSFRPRSNLGVYGGFAGFEYSLEDRDPQLNPTVLSGDLQNDDGPDFTNYSDNSYHVVTCSGTDSSLVMDGLIIRGGNADDLTERSGGGIFLPDGGATITSCVIQECSAQFGGGAYFGSVTWTEVQGCTFEHNQATRDGGGIYSGTAALRLQDCLLDQNESVDDGGGVLLDVLDVAPGPELRACRITANSGRHGAGLHISGDHSAIIDRCWFSGNVAQDDGGGIRTARFTRPIIRNTVFFANQATTGGGVMVLSIAASATFTGCTFAMNTASLRGGGVMNSVGHNLVVDHSIAYHNTPDQIHGISDLIQYSCVQDWDGSGLGAGNIDDDPLFVDLPGGDLSLQPSSPCIDAGDPLYTPAPGFERDHVGASRLLDGDLDRAAVVDMGAMEYSHVQLRVTGDPTPGTTVVITTSGTPGWKTFLFVGASSGTLWVPPYGYLFVDLGGLWDLYPWPSAPSSVQAQIPLNVPTPLPLTLQHLAFGGGSGSVSNDVQITVRR